MDILAMLTGAAALPGAPIAGANISAAPLDEGFAALLVDAPPAPVAGLPLAAVPPVDAAAPLPDPSLAAAPDQPLVLKADPVKPVAKPSRPAAAPIAAEPLPLVTEIVDESQVAPRVQVASVDPAGSGEAEPIAEPRAADTPAPEPRAAAAMPAMAAATTAPAPKAETPQPEPGGMKLARAYRSDPAPARDDQPDPAPAGPARPALTAASDRAAPEAAFRVDAPSPSLPAPAAPAAPAMSAAIAAPASVAAHHPAPPVATAAAEPPQRPTPSVAIGHGFGERMGLAIARRVGEGGDELVVRMEPAELGRIQVRLAFDEQGSLRAVLSADSSSVIEALRRDAGDLARALGDAGVRTDGQSFRFDRGGSQAGEQGHAAWSRWQNQQQGQGRMAAPGEPEETAYRPMRRSGRLDLMA